MSVIPCQKNPKILQIIEQYAETLKNEAHTLGSHGLSESEFYDSGVFRGAIERIRGQFSATMREKRNFVRFILNYMQDNEYIQNWESSGESNRHDYTIKMFNGRICAIELKGCLDGNNTNIFERPPNAHEFIIWSVCTNATSDPRHNVWSGIHTRLSAEIYKTNQVVDGVIVWDWLCDTASRPCPKIHNSDQHITTVGPYRLPPPCLYLFPGTIPSVRSNPSPVPQQIEDVHILKAFQECFGGKDDELNHVRFEVYHKGRETVRTTY